MGGTDVAESRWASGVWLGAQHVYCLKQRVERAGVSPESQEGGQGEKE